MGCDCLSDSLDGTAPQGSQIHITARNHTQSQHGNAAGQQLLLSTFQATGAASCCIKLWLLLNIAHLHKGELAIKVHIPKGSCGGGS